MQKKLDHIHHIALQVQSIEQALAWYQSQLHCEILYQDDSWALLRFANIELALVLPDEHPPHIAVVRDEISQYGQVMKHRDGTSSVYIRDLDQNTIEMLQLKKS